MENNPKKSKALIIVIILVLLLLFAGYYLYKNGSQIFGTKGSSSISKIFSPLLGTSKNKDLGIVDTGTVQTGTSDTTQTNQDANKRVGIVVVDAEGNRIVQSEAGEDIKKGDVLYISNFNSNNIPIVMKAIASDKTKSLVFGVAGEDMNKGNVGNVIISGVLNGVTTKRKEGTAWATNNPLYLSDKIYGGMTKNIPKFPSLTVPVGSVIKVDITNGSIRIGDISNNKNISNALINNWNSLSSDLLGDFNSDFLDYWNSVFGSSSYGGIPVSVVNLPNGTTTYGTTNGGTTINNDGTCRNGAVNPTLCTVNIDGKCLNGAANPNICTVNKDGVCLNGMTNPPTCTTTTKADVCTDKTATNYNKEGTCDYTIITKGVCPADAELTYTDEEKVKLAELTRKFYLLAPTIRTLDDVNLSASEIVEQQNLVNQTKGLTQECYNQKAAAGITEPVYGNPWFRSTDRGVYLPGYEDFELMLNIW